MSDSPYIYEINEQNFEQIIIQGSHQVPILVDFWADWCQPCKTLMPMLAQLANEYQGKFVLAKINTEEQQAIASQFGIRSIPTVKLFKDGQEIDEFAGALPESEVRAFLDKHLPRESDGFVEQAGQAMAAGDNESALQLLDQAQKVDPGNPKIILMMAEIHTNNGNLEAANTCLDALPPAEQDSPMAVQLRERIHFEQVAADAPPVDELQARLATDENDSDARLQLANLLIASQDYENAMEQLLTLMQKDAAFADNAARTTLLKVFDILAGDPVVNRYRNRMFNMLY